MWFVSMLGFGSFTASTVKLRCLLPRGMYGYFIEWGTASGIPAFIIIPGLIINQRRRKTFVSLEIAKFDVDQTVKEIITLRRFLFLIAVIYFMPITLSVIHAFSCYSTFGEGMIFRLSRRDVFLYDNNQACDEIVFQVIHLLLIFPMMIYVVVLPLFLILFTLRQRKWDLLDRKESFYGFVYESYTRRLCFWEAIPMLRKLLGILLTDTVLTHPFYQIFGHLCLTGFYLLLVILFRPYRNFYWKNRFMNNHVILDVVCNVGIAVLQGGSLLLVFDVYEGFIDYLIILTICIVIVYWIICIFTSQFEKQRHVVVEITRSDASMSQDTTEGDSVENIQLHQVASKKSVSFTGKNNKVANGPDTLEITRSDASMSQDTTEGDSVENIQLHQVASKTSVSFTGKNNKVANGPDTLEITRSDASMSQDTENDMSEGDSVENIQLHQVASKKSVSFIGKNNKVANGPDTFDF
ncbi:uncharacterized protein LOC126819299 isoform X2 [Patella vulgata]|nr:uncharacterized protein LOC126819299 isoform X2 [Patella vulgata]